MKPEDFWLEPVDTSEIRRLDAMPTEAGIPHEFVEEPEMGGASIKIPTGKKWFEWREGISIIQHFGSYGGRSGQLECWCQTKKRTDNEPIGWLTAEEVLAMVKEAL